MPKGNEVRKKGELRVTGVTFLQTPKTSDEVVFQGEVHPIPLDPFLKKEYVEIHDNKGVLAALQDSYLKGEITEEDLIEQVNALDTRNRSFGVNVLFDGRHKMDVAVDKYVEFAVAQGQDEAEARKFAISAFLEHRKNAPNKKNKRGWGTVASVRDIRD